MLQFPEDYFQAEVRCGFAVSETMKREDYIKFLQIAGKELPAGWHMRRLCGDFFCSIPKLLEAGN